MTTKKHRKKLKTTKSNNTKQDILLQPFYSSELSI